MSDEWDVEPWEEGGVDLPFQEPLAELLGQCPSSQDRMLLLGGMCFWAEVAAVVVSGKGQLTWTRGPVWDRDGRESRTLSRWPLAVVTLWALARSLRMGLKPSESPL